MEQNCTAIRLLHRAVVVSIQLPVTAAQCASCIGEQAFERSSRLQVDGDKVSEHVPQQPLRARWSGLQATRIA